MEKSRREAAFVEERYYSLSFDYVKILNMWVIRTKCERRKPGFYIVGDGKFSGVMDPFICIF